ncbi:MAG: hypothetical protein A2Y38_00270 [Spirochaetes bacterium GWB1_59_5]|nr:MAG: hypothetical protein A2Y38_00270 [Spirochaetes bacterium GWB1_59_5]
MSAFIIALLLVFMTGFCAAAIIANKNRHDFYARERAAQAAAIAAKENTHDQIQSTPAPVLVARDPDPAARSADATAIADRFRQRVRDRLGRIVQRRDGA